MGLRGIFGSVKHGVSNVDGTYPAVTKVALLEGKNTAQCIDIFFYFLNTAGTRCPDLRSDEVADRDFLFLGDPGDAEVDGGGIDGDDDVGFAALEFAFDEAERVPPVAGFGKERAGEHGGAFDGVGDEAATGGGHELSADADEGGVGVAFFQRADEGCAEGVSGVFSGGEKKRGQK